MSPRFHQTKRFTTGERVHGYEKRQVARFDDTISLLLVASLATVDSSSMILRCDSVFSLFGWKQEKKSKEGENMYAKCATRSGY
jgi:hypothetical protein